MINEGSPTPDLTSNVPKAEKTPDVLGGAENDPNNYLKGQYFIELSIQLTQYGPFKTKAYIYGRGIVDIEKRDDDPSRVYVVTDSRHSHQLRSDDEIYLSEDSLNTIKQSVPTGMTPEEKGILDAHLDSKLQTRKIQAANEMVEEITAEKQQAALEALQDFKEAEGMNKKPASDISEQAQEDTASDAAPEQDVAA